MRGPLRAVALALALAPVPAMAAPVAAPGRVVAAVPSERYAPGDQPLPQGESLLLVNLDRSPHDVVAVDTGPDGWPLFQSAILTQPGETSAVAGVESLEPGIYQFYCSVHEQMRGTVTVA